MPRKNAAKKKTARKQKPKPRETATTKWVSFRLPHKTLAQIEQYQKWLSRDFGLPINRATALVHLVAAITRGRIDDNLFNILTQPAKEWLRKYHHVLVGAGISMEGCRLLDSIMRRRLIQDRPIETISSMMDGVMVDHPAWLPVEVHTTSEAWKYHEHNIIKYLGGRQDTK